jgi:hypothetical protein
MTGAYWQIDTGFAALLVLLTAVDAGLGALFFGITDAPPCVRPTASRTATRRRRDLHWLSAPGPQIRLPQAATAPPLM